MNTPTASVKSPVLWVDAPSRTGIAWVAHNVRRQFRHVWLFLLNHFIGLLGALSTPGMKHIGAMQAWALRRMGARCDSSQVWIGPRAWFDYPEHVVFGRRVTIGAEARITAHATVVLGDDLLAAAGLSINSGSHDLATLTPTGAPVVIGAGVWCGTRVTLCAGVTVGRGAVVGAGSVVVKDLPPEYVCTGVPCKPRRDIAPLRAGGGVAWSNFRCHG